MMPQSAICPVEPHGGDRAYAAPRSEASLGTKSRMFAAWQSPRPRSSIGMALEKFP